MKSLSQDRERLNAALHTKEKETIDLKEKLKVVDELKQKLAFEEKEKSALLAMNGDKDSATKELLSKLRDLEGQVTVIPGLKAKLTALNTELERVMFIINEKNVEINTLKVKLEELNTLKENLAVLNEERDALTNELEQLEVELNQTRGENNQMQEFITAKYSEIEDLKLKVSRGSKLEKQLKASLQEKEKIKDLLAQKTQECEGLKVYIERLGAELNDEPESPSGHCCSGTIKKKKIAAQKEKESNELKVKLVRLGEVEKKLQNLLSEKDQLGQENERLTNSIAEKKKKLNSMKLSAERGSLTSLTSITKSQTFSNVAQRVKTEDSPRRLSRSPTLNDSLLSGSMSPMRKTAEPKSATTTRKFKKSKTLAPCSDNDTKSIKSVVQLTEIEEILNAQDSIQEPVQERSSLAQEYTSLKKDLAKAKQEIARLKVLVGEGGAVRPELQTVMEERDNLNNQLGEKTEEIKNTLERINGLEEDYKMAVREKETAIALIDEKLENIEKLGSKLKETEEQISFVIAHAKATMLASQNERANTGLGQRVKVLEEWQSKYGAVEKLSETTKEVSSQLEKVSSNHKKAITKTKDMYSKVN